MYICVACKLHNIKDHCLHSLWYEWLSLPLCRYNIHLYMWLPALSPLCHLLIGLIQVLSNFRSSVSTLSGCLVFQYKFFPIKEKVVLEYHYPLYAPKPKDPIPEVFFHQASSGGMTVKREVSASVSDQPVSSSFPSLSSGKCM